MARFLAATPGRAGGRAGRGARSASSPGWIDAAGGLQAPARLLAGAGRNGRLLRRLPRRSRAMPRDKPAARGNKGLTNIHLTVPPPPMSRSALTLKALGERIARLPRGWQNRIWAHRARLGGRPRGGRGAARADLPRRRRARAGAARRALAGARAARSRPAGARSGPRRCPTGGWRRSGRPASGSTTSPRSATGRRAGWRRPGCRTGSTASAPAAARAGSRRRPGGGPSAGRCTRRS